MENLSTLSDSALLALSYREGLSSQMLDAIVEEMQKRVKRMEREKRIRALEKYWADSVSESVLNDYRAGNVRYIWAG